MVQYKVGDKVEVLSRSSGGWEPAEVVRAAEREEVIDGYTIPAGGIKVAYKQASKWIMPDDVPKTVRMAPEGKRKSLTDGGKRKSLVNAYSGGGDEDVKCRFGCGFPVQPGLTRTLARFDTCCKRCSKMKGQGGHDPNCAGAAGVTPQARVRRASIYYGPNPRIWIEELLKDNAKMQAHLQSVYKKSLKSDAAALTDKEAWTAIQDHLLEKVTERLHVSLPERDSINQKVQKKAGYGGRRTSTTAGGYEVGIDLFSEWACELLKRRVDMWFPPKLTLTTACFVRKNPNNLTTVYEVGKKLGEGSFGVVNSVTHKISKETRVCKKILKMKGSQGMDIKEIRQEIDNMALLDHPGLIKVYEYFEDATSIVQIIEPCKGGELQDRIDAVFRHKTEKMYTEAWMCDIMKQMMRALAFMHSSKYLHKDLKPQNIMLVQKSKPGDTQVDIKVIDFGLAELFTRDQTHSDQVGGTLLYMAPEVFQQNLGFKSDVWSAGVILFNLVTGDYPFLAKWPLPPGKDIDWWQKEVRRLIEGDAPPKRCAQLTDGSVSPECINSLNMMLKKQEAVRPSSSECLQHAWYSNFDMTPPPLSVGITQCLEAYAAQPDLKKSLFLLIANQSTTPALGELRAIFTHFDEFNKGTLHANVLRDVLLRSHMSPLQVERVLMALDRDNSGEIRWTEFIAAAICIAVSKNQNLLNALFSTFDTDADGSISSRDLLAVLAPSDNRASSPEHRAIWKERLPEELKKLAPPRPNGPFNIEHIQHYMEGYMHTSAGNALHAVSA